MTPQQIADNLGGIFLPDEQLQHVTDGSPCWCNPVMTFVPNSDGCVVVHTCAYHTLTQDRHYWHGAN